MDHSTVIAQKICTFLDNGDWHYTYDEEKGIIRMGVNLKGKMQRCKIFITIGQAHYTVYALPDFNINEKCRMRVAEYLTRANYNLRFGNFELNLDDGDIRYKMAVDCENEEAPVLSDAVIARSIYIPPRMLDQYGDGLLSVMFGNTSPKEAEEAASS